MNLTKREIVARITEATGLKQTEVAAMVQKTFDHITRTLAQGGKVELRNFGVFEVKLRQARIGRNLKQPEVAVPIAARATVKFKAGKAMHDAVLKLTPPAPLLPAPFPVPAGP
jgi:nucleoid DNA-binding protein